MPKPTYVTKPYFPPIEKYFKYIQTAYDNNSLTNNGPLVQKLTERLKNKLGVKHLLLVNNGTIALQVAYQIKNLAGKKVITTPYTFAATATALQWQGAKVVLGDIDTTSWNLAPHSVEQALAKKQAEAIVAVNLFGQPCELDALESLAKQYKVPLIYDSSHALLSTYKGKSIFNYGDIHCISFHATKLFHCVEGGAMVFNSEEEYLLAKKLINFGIEDNGDVNFAGINGKLSEVHAAMGLCVLDDIEALVAERQALIDLYKHELNDLVTYQQAPFECYTQPIYMPVQFNTEAELIAAEKALKAANIFPRRYFVPENYKFLKQSSSQSIKQCGKVANRVLCLPLMNGLPPSKVVDICDIIKS